MYAPAGYLPDQILVVALDDWVRLVTITDAVLWRRPEQTPSGEMRRVDVATAWAHFTKVVFQRFFRTPCEELIPPALGLDSWAYRTG